jgi:hypothetical protein
MPLQARARHSYSSTASLACAVGFGAYANFIIDDASAMSVARDNFGVIRTVRCACSANEHRHRLTERQ